MPNFEIPTLEEIRAAVRDEMQSFVSTFQFPQNEPDEIGGIELAVKITGKAKPTIYSLCHQRLIPHSKQGKQLYFSRNELTEWLRQGKRKTHRELALEAENLSSTNSRQPKSIVTAR
jgi:predicted DNA-binding transcriptional regulator AlpA